MRIAQVAPLFESVPPKLYGGTERVVSYLTEELVRQGHDVTLFASGDSVTAARLVAGCPRSLRLDPQCVDQLAHQLLMLERVFQTAAEFDVVHFHVDYLHFPLSRRHDAAARDDAARPARHPGPRAALPASSARCPWCRSPTRSARPLPWLALARRPSITGCPRDLYTLPSRRRGELPRVPRPDLAREAGGSRDRDRTARRHAAPDRGQDRPRRTRRTSSDDRSRCSREPLRRVHRRDRRGREGRRSSATRSRCCSRSTGRSRSGW